MASDAPKLKLLELRLKRAFTLSQASATRKNTLIARYKSGMGEGSSSIHYGLSSEDNLSRAQELMERFTADWDDEAVMAFADSLPDDLNVARCAVEMALLDYQAKEERVPLHELLRAPYPESITSAFTVTFASNDDIVKQLEGAAAFRILKLKVGFDGDIDFVEFVLKHGAKRVFLDANGGWTKDQAVERIKSMSGYPIEFYEQPTANPSERDLGHIKDKVDCRVFLDESIRTALDVEKFCKVVDGVNLKLSKCGGLRSVLALAELARSKRLKLMIGCMLESGIGITAALHIASPFDYHDLDAIMLTENDPFWGAMFDGDVMMLPVGTGIGITTRETILA